MMSSDDRGAAEDSARDTARKGFVEYLRRLPNADEICMCEGFPGSGGDEFSALQLADSVERGEERGEQSLDAWIRVEAKYGHLRETEKNA